MKHCLKPAAALCALLALIAVARSEEMKFVCSRDVWVSACPTGDEGQDERDTSMGKTPRLKIKTIQEMALLDFELSKLKGRKITGGWLYINIVHDPKEVALNIPLERKHFLRRIGLSTVSSDWKEGRMAEEYKVDKKGLGATFRAASGPSRAWAWPGSNLTDVTMGNGNTLQHHAELEDLDDMWARIKVPPELIQSLVVRDSFGWLIMDEIGYGLVNNFIHSREAKGKEPYLVVQVENWLREPPASATVSVRPAPEEAHLKSGAVAIDITGPADTFCHVVKVNGKDVPRWKVPHPERGKATVILDDRKPGEAISVEVVGCDAAGQTSPAAKATGKASAALGAPPRLPDAWKPKPGDVTLRSDRLRVWAFPEICKVNPTTGALFEALTAKKNAFAYQRANSVWNGADNSVRLFGAKGEIVSFQLCLERVDHTQPLKDLSVSLAALAGPGRIAADRIRLFRVWYVKAAEYAVPMARGQKLSIPMPDNQPNEQNNQAVIVDIAVPKGAKAGLYKGAVKIAAQGVKPFELPVSLLVYNFIIPDKMRFNPELNIYQSPGRPGSETFFEAYRVAHYNRCTLSITQAGHSDGVKTPLRLAGRGADIRVRDWAEYDRTFGPLLDGSAFKGLPREGVPLAVCQIPMSHGYPMPFDRNYDFKGAGNNRHQQIALIHALLCKPLDRALGEPYKQGFKNFARRFVEHVEKKGWTDTVFLFYLDAKVQWRWRGRGSSYWILDEPYNYDDWMALRFWGKLFLDGIKDAPKKTTWGYRCDISRPHWTRDWLDGVMTHMYAGGFTRRLRRCQTMAKKGPMIVYSYGSCNRPQDSHWNSAAWCLTTFAGGGDGVLPWQSLGNTRTKNPLKEPDPQGLILLNVLGHKAIGSIRIMALRRGAQDCEYLLTLGETLGLNREQLRALVAAKVATKATLHQVHEDDAAPVTFGALGPDQFAALREGVAKLIAEKK